MPSEHVQCVQHVVLRTRTTATKLHVWPVVNTISQRQKNLNVPGYSAATAVISTNVIAAIVCSIETDCLQYMLNEVNVHVLFSLSTVPQQ